MNVTKGPLVKCLMPSLMIHDNSFPTGTGFSTGRKVCLVMSLSSLRLSPKMLTPLFFCANHITNQMLNLDINQSIHPNHLSVYQHSIQYIFRYR